MKATAGRTFSAASAIGTGSEAMAGEAGAGAAGVPPRWIALLGGACWGDGTTFGAVVPSPLLGAAMLPAALVGAAEVMGGCCQLPLLK